MTVFVDATIRVQTGDDILLKDFHGTFEA